MINSSTLENFNFIDYSKIIDLSILNLLDYSDFIENACYYQENDDRLIVNLNPKNKKMLEGFIINNINNELSYGKTNIILNSCHPNKNWRNITNKTNINRFNIIDDSIYISDIDLNAFSKDLFNRLPSITATLIKKSGYGNVDITSSHVSIMFGKKIKFLEFENLDIIDAYQVLNVLLSQFGDLTMSNFNYNNNIIKDGNCDFNHNSEISQDIIDNVRIKLIEKEII